MNFEVRSTTNFFKYQHNCRNFSKTVSFKKTFLRFLFPFFPIRLSQTTHLLVLLALMVSLRIITKFFTFPVGPVMRAGITWVPIAMIGWIYGPVLGIFLGIFTDTITWMMSSGTWFWMYALIEPAIMVVAGMIGSIYRLRLYSTKWIYDLIFHQTVLIVFLVISFFGLIYYGTNSFISSNGKFNKGLDLFGLTFKSPQLITKWTQILTGSVLISFFVIIEIIVLYYLTKHVKNKQNPCLFLYVSLLMPLLSVLFSFLLGTIAAIEFFNFLHHGKKENNNLVNFGFYYYLIPRVIKEVVRNPILIAITIAVLKLVEPNLKQIYNKLRNQW